ncbi:LuxR C-terminal-related transcriptional regulator [Nocardia sp. NBC_00511]|uniref:helix-turn-helix transcriptional regulator n=1 Tax=Nocardia sp. NBC_00511 TaxID=2903591 RepID=UPI0030E109DB
MLYGRDHELRQIRTLLTAAAQGSSGVLAITADAGEGKSALLNQAATAAGPGWRILRCSGIECESELPFAGLHQLLSGTLEHLDLLPAPQARALGCALGLCESAGTDRFLVGVATVTLLAELSADIPVLCLIDDAQWLDRPSLDVLCFAARRLGAENIAMLFAGRREFTATGLPELRMEPLDSTAATALLADRWPGLTGERLGRVLGDAAGNPLALLELPRMDLDASPAEPLPLPLRLQTGYEREIAACSAAARTAMLVVAAEETGDLALVLGALRRLGLDAESLAEAEQSGMLTVTERRVSFRHPLRRSAAYHGASFTRRLAVHAALADVLAADPARSAWHLAAASTEPDENVAAALESAAIQAQQRGGHASAAVAFERAAWLTPDLAARTRRLVLAVETAAEAGLTARALRLASATEALDPEPVYRARILGVRARIDFEDGSLGKARRLAEAAAVDMAEHEPESAAWFLVEAGRIALTAGDRAAFDAIGARLAALPLPEEAAPLAALRGARTVFDGELAAGIALIRANVEFSRTVPVDAIGIRLAFVLQAALIGDMAHARLLLVELVDLVLARGMIGWYPSVGGTLAIAEMILGRFREAEATATQVARVAADIGQHNRVVGAEGVLAFAAAIRGDERRCRELAERNLDAAPGDRNAIDTTHFEWALAVVDLGAGRYEHALARLTALHEQPNLAHGQWTELLSDLVEAAARARRPERAAAALAEIDSWATALAEPWAEALLLRCQAMIHGDGEKFAQALKLHAEADRRYDHARTALVYGEWLRRERRLGEARTHLRAALETFDRLGVTPRADQARNELRAAGEGSVPEPENDLAAVLTAQELQVVRLAAVGATNKEIAAQLFLSPKTVAHHLYRAFPKLGVNNRVELARLDLA